MYVIVFSYKLSALLWRSHPKNTLCQKFVHPKDPVVWHEESNIVNAVKCQEACQDLYIGEAKQPLAKHLFIDFYIYCVQMFHDCLNV